MSILRDCHMGVKPSWKCFESLHTHEIRSPDLQGLPEPCFFRSQLGLRARVSSCKSNLRSCPNLSPNVQCFRSLRSRRRDLAGPGPSPAPTAPFSCAKKGRTGCIRTICAGVSLCWAVHKLPSPSLGHPQPRVAQGQLLPEDAVPWKYRAR